MHLYGTNAISALVHQRAGFERLAARIDATRPAERGVSTITLSEVQTMIANASAPREKGARVWRILLNFRILDFDEAAALHAGLIRAYLEPRGLKIGPLDTLIAAHARSLDAVLITDNVREFARVPSLAVESWAR
jgi:tRNA(fMet)-specific endonuclease VapC